MTRFIKYVPLQNYHVTNAYYYVGSAYEIRLRSKGLTNAQTTEMIAHYQRFCKLAEGHPAVKRILGFFEVVKAKKPVPVKGRWILKVEKKAGKP